MSELNQRIATMLEMLPEEDQIFAYEFVRKLVQAWDPDYTKLTPSEKLSLEEAMNDPETVTFEEALQELGLTKDDLNKVQ